VSHRTVTVSHRTVTVSHRTVTVSHRIVTVSHRTVTVSHRTVTTMSHLSLLHVNIIERMGFTRVADFIPCEEDAEFLCIN